MIHATAVISKKAQVGSNVSVGPYCVIEDGALIGDGSRLIASVFVAAGAVIGRDNVFYPGAVIGTAGQHRAAEEPARGLVIGDGNLFREHVTVHKSAFKDGTTRVGNKNFIMVGAHIGHDSQVGSNIVITNAVLLGGHAVIEDHAVLSGGAAIHQFCRVGRYAMVGGNATATRDVPPFMLMDDGETRIGSINVVGMRRAGFSEEVKRDIKNAYKALYLSGWALPKAIEAIERECLTPEGRAFAVFLKSSKRGILGHRRRHEAESSPSALLG